MKISNGKEIETQDPILVFANKENALITSSEKIAQKSKFPYEETLIDFKNNFLYQIGHLNKSKKISTTDSLTLTNQTFELSNETKKILGYNCKKASIIINSNTITLWYTNDLKTKAGPIGLGANLGLILEYNRNNTFIIRAEKIEAVTEKQFPNVSNLIEQKNTDQLTYRDLLWKSRFTIINVFENEIINFSDDSKSKDSILRFANGTIILRKIKFPEIQNGNNIFIDLLAQSNGDAYDRTGSVFIIPEKKSISFFDALQNGVQYLPKYSNGNQKEYQGIVATEDYDPTIELMRFFTPFGIKQYNHIKLKDKEWHESVSYRQDISELQSVFNNETLYIGAFIGNYDKGGHKISLNITIHSGGNSSENVKKVIPLFNTTNIMEMAGQNYATMFDHEDGLKMKFTLKESLKNVRLKYITTGHGGWENGDEFVPKKTPFI